MEENLRSQVNDLTSKMDNALSARNHQTMVLCYESLSNIYDELSSRTKISRVEFVLACKIQLSRLKYLAFGNFYGKVHDLSFELLSRIDNLLNDNDDSTEQEEVKRAKKEIEQINKSVRPIHDNLTIPRFDTRCCLCRTRIANKTGSHMVPNFLAHPSFAVDDKGKRFKEALDHDFVNHPERNCQFYGREVPVERILQGKGSKMLDDDYAEHNINQLEYDNEFCSICEDRWGILETAYSEYYSHRKNIISPRISYLFWLSVLFRMSLGRMGLFLDTKDDLNLRDILDNGIKNNVNEISTDTTDLGTWNYALYKAEGLLKEGDKGIIASDYHYPYVIMVNDLIVVFYRHEPADEELTVGPISIKRENLNSWKTSEKQSTFSRREFWEVRDWCIDTHTSFYDPPKEDALLLIREKERTDGKEISSEVKELLVHARRLANPQLQPRIKIRKMRRFVIADIRRKEAEANGKVYDILKDEELFLSQENINNYYQDLSEAAQCGFEVSGFPFYDEARAALPDADMWKHKKSPSIPCESEYINTMNWYMNEVLNEDERREQLERMGISTATTYRSTRFRRNDPCPCGSGKKYKKCCGR